MKTVLILSVVLCAALSVWAAAVVPAEAATVQLADKAAPEPEVVKDIAVEDTAVEETAVEETAVEETAVEETAVEDIAVEDTTAVAAGRPAGLRQTRFSFCLDGWQSFSGKCYFLANHPDSWADAERFCASYDGSLASVGSIWEYNFLQRMVKTGGHAFAWIGGYYFEGEWRWEDGSRFDYSNWDTSRSTAYHQCLLLNSQVSKGWSNNRCNMPFPFVCQVRQLDC
ncbi:ladderlectin-like [Seriola lalandi dorsalis]|uniref:Ladderlectin-like n=1 Tax=Seriola lalandi dorsalis TaxID=1841481 RepID=A0A3B4Y2K6_SERLL|nr:ladderlectin-like [Seriola lalandi dorsalis]